ncbi:hypothetical protein EVAR_69308_1 [Eumeta japonica]|uniref:Uncharacterized protein n=1 Tax=Eumeta variegata TaxID=151549 RepID=A0A4C2A2U3_EUMVA|nr:hypothetical protein EVAR_69308_1 [Eumeta japonica]
MQSLPTDCCVVVLPPTPSPSTVACEAMNCRGKRRDETKRSREYQFKQQQFKRYIRRKEAFAMNPHTSLCTVGRAASGGRHRRRNK